MAIQTPNIQAVFFDIDGTIVSFKTHSIPPDTKAAINQLRDKGIKVIIATGRSLRDINNLEDLEFDGFITANGAYCVDSKGKVIAQHQFSKENLDSLALFMKDKPFSCSFVTDRGNFINYIDDRVLALSRLVNTQLPPVKPLAEILKRPVYQIDAFVDAVLERELLTDVLTDCISCRWHQIFSNLNTKNSSKAAGMDCFLVHFGISGEHSMAFGDGGNDISMLRHAAIGVAMGTAGDHVKTAADYVTTSVDDEGVAKALKYYMVI